MATGLRADWFDGRSSRARPVLATLVPAAGGPLLTLQPLDVAAPALTLSHRQVQWPEAWSAGAAPRRLVVDLGAQGSLEVADAAGWHAAVAAAGGRAPLAQRMQTRWSTLLAVAVLAVAALAGGYRWGTPWLATQLTRHVPLAWEVELAQRALQDLDASWLQPSQLPPARQAQLRARFDTLLAQLPPDRAGYAPSFSLHFRRGMGANAFALPGGTLVLTDDMVAAAASHGLPDAALLGVLAHEIGHVVHRHTTRMVVEQGVLNVGLGLALGDVSTVVSMGASVLTGLAYRRGHESQADCFAVALLARAGLPAPPMAQLLLAVEREQDGASADTPGSAALFSSHPQTRERARALQEGNCLRGTA